MWNPPELSGQSSGGEYEEPPLLERSESPRRDGSPRRVHWSDPPARAALTRRREPTPRPERSPRREKGKGKGKSKGKQKGKRGRGQGGQRAPGRR